MKYTHYTTSGDETWPQIAQNAYGDPFRWPEILAANPRCKISEFPPRGHVLHIAIDETTVATTSATLPPWRRI